MVRLGSIPSLREFRVYDPECMVRVYLVGLQYPWVLNLLLGCWAAVLLGCCWGATGIAGVLLGCCWGHRPCESWIQHSTNAESNARRAYGPAAPTSSSQQQSAATSSSQQQPAATSASSQQQPAASSRQQQAAAGSSSQQQPAAASSS